MLPSDDRLPDTLHREMRRTPHLGAIARARVMSAVRREAQRPRRAGWISPLLGTALAASLTIAVAGGVWLRAGGEGAALAPGAHVLARGSSIRDTLLLVRFAFTAPAAARVALVGDFNDWGTQRTALARGADGVWVADVAMARGRHRYAYVVDDTGWVTDAPALDTLPGGRRATRLDLVNPQ
ncbi:MAG: isoamylase early set domain-containing protein [Gemmatimonadetes bacterium]|nr:isoamylase early set domain-containing protein [Gemmatimonadota bacterium]MBI3567645.1 isoamylase early set domain-containing protein [Gemmatimonadota bacterium]